MIGLYVPARDASVGKTERKRKWLAACDAALAATVTGMPAIVLGDLNVLEPSHHLHPDDAEYSWAGRIGDGYRYDHAFCCRSLVDRLAACDYLHQPRFDGLSDHSALTMHLAIRPPAALSP